MAQNSLTFVDANSLATPVTDKPGGRWNGSREYFCEYPIVVAREFATGAKKQTIE